MTFNSRALHELSDISPRTLITYPQSPADPKTNQSLLVYGVPLPGFEVGDSGLLYVDVNSSRRVRE